jgi:hypothetical protein
MKKKIIFESIKRTTMKVMLDIRDSKAAFVMELLRSLPFVKASPLSDEKARLIGEIKEAVENIELVRKGKLKARPARDIINDL